MLSWRDEFNDANPETYNRYSVAFILILSALLMLRQFAASSYFTVNIDDAFIYTSWAWQFNEALKEGTIYPRWLPLNFWGYGSPTFLLYPPLAYYMVALFNLITDSIIAAMNLAKFTTLFLSGTGIYFLVKEFYPARVALLSAVFCLILPVNIVMIYLFGSIAAMVSSLWFAPILLFIYKYCKIGDCKYLVYSGACYGGLILTHLITAYMFTFVIVAFAAYLALIRKMKRYIISIPVVLLTGLSLSAAYILPVIFERRYVNLETFTTDTNSMIYSNMFILPDMTARFTQGQFWPIYYNTIVLHTFVLSLFMLLVILIRSAKPGEFENTTVVNNFFLTTGTCSILLMFGISSIVWKTIPFFKYIIFPARWLHITAFASAFLSASVFVPLYNDNRTNNKYIILPAILFLSCIAWDFYYITGAPSFDKNELFPASSVNSTLEHLPRGVRLDKIDRSQNAGNGARIAVLGEGTAENVSWKSTERVVDVKAEKLLRVRFRIFNFPGWRAFVDGTETQIAAESDTRAITVNVPQGAHRLKLVFRDTPVRRWGKLISLVSLALLAISVIIGWISNRNNTESTLCCAAGRHETTG